jgi:ketosteroid isomerase-like protein
MSTTTAPTDLHAARQRNEQVWRESSRAMYAGRLEEFLGYWTENGRYEVVYPVPGVPAVVEGHAALRALFTGLLGAATHVEVHDVRFHQTDDPDVAVVEERMVAELRDGGHYENRLIIRVTFRDGLLAELLEYYGQHAHETLLRRIGAVPA